MALRIFNTASSRDELFTPVEKGKVGMYVCGPTAYDYSHIGHAKTYLVYDVIKRYLLFLGYKVKHIQNLTNIDENITRRALKADVEPLEMSDKFIHEYLKDMDSLNIIRADVYPRTSDHIGDCIRMTQDLLDKGFAYETKGDVYFDTSKPCSLGTLIHEKLEHVVSDDLASLKFHNPGRRAHLDFAVWKRARPWELSWHSPWGEGRPGWHTECAIMSHKYIGPTVDIHGGGMDLIFPHHESEAVLSEALTGEPAARYWIHNQFVTVEGEKMSKSRGNLITIREALERAGPDALRFYLLSVHYRKRLAFSCHRLDVAKETLEHFRETVTKAITKKQPHLKDVNKDLLESCIKAFYNAMDNDFDTPRAMTCLRDLVRLLEKCRVRGKNCDKVTKALLDCQKILGIDLGVED